MRVIIAITLLLAAISAVSAANYAVLVAGSNGYYNYRHQSDVCHAFQILSDPAKGNIPRDNIITFMYDDIANSPSNPFPGNIINHPNGTNVYTGVKKDYTGEAVTPDNFLKVLAGNATSTGGPTLKTTAEDNLFIYFADHGAPGLIAFPSSYLYATDLMSTLKYMFTNKKYKQLVFYVEACESGSMFANILSANMSIYATTAATPDQSSYACYYDASRNTYLGDEYSVRWMENSDTEDKKGSMWTLAQQFQVVQQETLQSQPQQYGDLSIAKEDITVFQASASKTKTTFRPPKATPPPYAPCDDPVDSRDVKLKTLMNRQTHARTSDMRTAIGKEIAAELANRASADFMVQQIVEKVVGAANKNSVLSAVVSPVDFDCYRTTIAGVEHVCRKFDDYSMKWLKVFATMCEHGVRAVDVITAARRVCGRN